MRAISDTRQSGFLKISSESAVGVPRRQHDPEATAAAWRAIQFKVTADSGDRETRDGEAEARSSRGPRARLVNPVEPLEDLLAMFGRNAG